MTQTCSSTSRRQRQQRFRELMERLERGARLLRRSANFAWYTNGGDDRVDHASPLGVAEVLITLDGDYIVTNNIEVPRVRDACLLHRKLL
jgi:hypothetical protein